MKLRNTRGYIATCLALMVIVLSACMVKQSPVQQLEKQAEIAERQQRWQVHRIKAAKLETWNIRGKIAVKAGNKGGHATLRWNRAKTLHIELSGPLGGGRVIIDSDAAGVRLQDTKGADLKGDSVSALISQRLGWPLPFDHMEFWLRGLPANKDATMQFDALGRIKMMNDSGWQVSYKAYQAISSTSSGQVDVPGSIELNALPGTLRVYDKKGEYLGEDFLIRLIIKSWLPG